MKSRQALASAKQKISEKISPDAFHTEDRMVARVMALMKIFQSKSWSLDSLEPESSFVQAFENCCHIAKRLSNDQFKLFSALLNDFIKIQGINYTACFRHALDQMPLPPGDRRRFMVAPVLAPKDVNKVKSGPHCLYSFKTGVWPHSAVYRTFHLETYEKAAILSQKNQAAEGSCTIFIDDFIGTGETAINFLDEYEGQFKQKNEMIVFLCIGILQKGYEAIKARGYDVVFYKKLAKGIGESTCIIDKASAYRLMDEIEEMLAVKGYKYGYSQSEALISLMNTPNNTFPMFWARRGQNNANWPAPFPRASDK
jgi:hypothetical protein